MGKRKADKSVPDHEPEPNKEHKGNTSAADGAGPTSAADGLPGPVASLSKGGEEAILRARTIGMADGRRGIVMGTRIPKDYFVVHVSQPT